MDIKKIMKTKLAKETLWSFLSKGISLILFLILSIYLTRNLGAKGFGLWSLLLSVITLISTLSYFGLNASSQKFVAQYNGTANLKNILLSSFKLRIIISLLFLIIFFLSYKKIALILNNSELEALFFYAIPMIFLSGLVEYLKAVFIGLHQIKYNFIISLLEFGLKLVLVILFFVFSNSVFSVINSFVLALLITSLVGFYLLYFNFYKNLKNSNKIFSREILNYSLPLFFVTLGFLALTEIDTIMIGFFFGTEEVGIYAIAKQIVVKLPHISLALAMGTMPVFAKLNNKNKGRLKRKFFRLLKINFGIYSVIILGLLFLSPVLIPIIFGNQFKASVLPLQILTVYLACFSISILFNTFLNYVGKAEKRAKNMSVTIILNIFLNLILIPKYGAIGASIATSISYLPYVILNWLEVKKSLQ